MSYALFFRQMSCFINTHNRGEFYGYSILHCQVINFQSFLCQFSIHEMHLFGDVLGPNSPQILPDSAKIFTTGSIQGNKSSAFKKFWKNLIFYRNGSYPEFTLLFQLWSLLPLEEDLKRSNLKQNHFQRKNSLIGLSKNCKFKTCLFCLSSEK